MWVGEQGGRGERESDGGREGKRLLVKEGEGRGSKGFKWNREGTGRRGEI